MEVLCGKQGKRQPESTSDGGSKGVSPGERQGDPDGKAHQTYNMNKDGDHVQRHKQGEPFAAIDIEI